VNTGTDMSPVWTAQTVGFLQDPDEGSFDVLWYELGRGFFFAVAPPNLTNSWRVIGSEVEPVVWEDANQTSINAIGRYEATIKDSTILDEDHAERRAVIELLKRGSEAGRITLITTRDGFEVGKLVAVRNEIRDIVGEIEPGTGNESLVYYLIDKMVMHGLGGAIIEYELSLRSVPV
jgi:hypothetical protein